VPGQSAVEVAISAEPSTAGDFRHPSRIDLDVGEAAGNCTVGPQLTLALGSVARGYVCRAIVTAGLACNFLRDSWSVAEYARA